MRKDRIGTILKKRIKEQGYTQEDFAEKVGIGLSSLKKYLRGEVAYNYEILIQFANELECSYDYLLGKSKTAIPEHKEIRERINLSDEAISILIKRTNEAKEDNTQAYFMKTLDLIITDENLIDDITLYLISNKTTNQMNNLFEKMGIAERLPYGNEIYLLVAILNELKEIKQSITGEVIKEYNNSGISQVLKALEEEI